LTVLGTDAGRTGLLKDSASLVRRVLSLDVFKTGC